MSFQANEILRKFRSSQDSKSANIFNGSECQNTDNDGYLRLSTTSETPAMELNVNGSSVAASSTHYAIDAQSNTIKNIEYIQEQNLLHEKLSRSFSSLLNQNSNPNTNFINTRFGSSDLKIEIGIELQKCYETIRVLRTENKTLSNEKKLLRQQSEQQKFKSDNIIADLRCQLALAKAGSKNTSKLSNKICSNLRKGSRFAKPLNDARDANTIHTLAQQFVDKIKPDNNLNSNALNNSHLTESEQYNDNVNNETMISELNGDLNYSSNTSPISHLSQPHRLEEGNDNLIINLAKSCSVDDDVLVMNSADRSDNNNNNDNNKTTFTNILLDTITREGINSKNMINHDNLSVNNQNNFIPLTSSPSQQHFQPFLRPSLLFSHNTNTNSYNDITTPHSTSNTSYVTPIPTIDSKQYQQHNAQQIHQLELMQNMYRNHLHQISLRTNQAQKLNKQQRVSSKKDNIPNLSYNSSNTINNSNPSHYLSNDHLQQTNPYTNGNTNSNINNNNNSSNSSSAASSPTKEDIDPRYARPVWNRKSPLSSPHKNNYSSVQQQLYPQQYHHLQQLQQQQQQTSTFLNYPSTQFQSQPQTYASSASAFTDLADVKKYNSYNNNSNNNNNNNNHDNTDSNANSSHTSANNNNNNSSIDNRYTITSSNTLDQIAANLLHQTNNSNEYHDDNTHESDDESSNLEFDLNSYL